MLDLDQQDRFVATRGGRVTLSQSLGSVDVYDFRAGQGWGDTPPVCQVRQRVSRCNERIGFYADEARSVALMYLDPPPRFDPWARYELVDSGSETIGAIQKAFVTARRRSDYVLYGGDGQEVARVEAQVPVAVGRRRAAGAAGSGALGIALLGPPAGLAVAAAVAVSATLRHVRDCVDPIDIASQLRIVRGDQTLGVLLRRSLAPTWPGRSPIPLPWESGETECEIDMTGDPSRRVDRRLVLAIPVALDVLRGVFAESAFR